MALWECFRSNVTAEVLSDIAHADYSGGVDEILPLLEEALATGALTLDSFQCREALELTKWPRNPGERGLWAQLFACACPLRMAVNRGTDGEEEMVAAFVSDAIRFGEPMARRAASALAARF